MTRMILGTLRGMDSPLQWAAGLSLGFAGGCLPVDSLIPWFVGLILILCGANLLTGAVGWGLGCGVAVLAGPAWEKLGFQLLNRAGLSSFWTSLQNLPAAAWFGFDDSLVVGSVFAAICGAVPLFLFSWFAGKPLRESLAGFYQRFPATRWLVDARTENDSLEAA